MKVSVVIPCRNEAQYIERCISSVLNCEYPKELLEILVCDGISEDKTQQIVKRISDEKSNVRLLINEKQTTPHALNLGINQSSGDVIIILGAHASISSDYISRCVSSLKEDKSLGCVGGVLHNTFSDTQSEAIAKAMSHPFGVGSAHFRTGNKSGYVDTVAFGAYKREVFEKIGLFDEDLVRNQDDEFNYRLIQEGFKIKLDNTITASYHVRASFTRLFRQYYQYGYWKVYVNTKHKALTSVRQLIPSIFVLYIIIGGVLSAVFPLFGKIYLVGLGFYTILGLLSAFSRNINPMKAIMTFFAFVILHLSYGVGYLEGLLVIKVLGKSPSVKRSTSSR